MTWGWCTKSLTKNVIAKLKKKEKEKKAINFNTSQRHNQPYLCENGLAFYKPACPTLDRTLAHLQL